MDRGAWWAAVHGATESQTRLSDWVTPTCPSPVPQKRKFPSFPVPIPRKEEHAIHLPSQRVSAYQDEIVHLNNFNIINVNNLVGTEIYGKVLAFGRF